MKSPKPHKPLEAAPKEEPKPKTSEFQQLMPIYAKKLNKLLDEMANKGMTIAPKIYVEMTAVGKTLVQKVVGSNYIFVPIPKPQKSKKEQKAKKAKRKKK